LDQIKIIMDDKDLIEILEEYYNKERNREVRLSDLEQHQQFKITEEFSIIPWKSNYWIDNEMPLDEKFYHKQLLKRRISHDKKSHKKDEILYKPYQKSQVKEVSRNSNQITKQNGKAKSKKVESNSKK